jgi:hypothetical protein
MVLTERNILEPARYSLLHNSREKMLDHILVFRTMRAYFNGSEVQNESLHDESMVFVPGISILNQITLLMIARFEMLEMKI